MTFLRIFTIIFRILSNSRHTFVFLFFGVCYKPAYLSELSVIDSLMSHSTYEVALSEHESTPVEVGDRQ